MTTFRLTYEENQYCAQNLGWYVYDGSIFPSSAATRIFTQDGIIERIRRQAEYNPLAKKVWEWLEQITVIDRLTGCGNTALMQFKHVPH